MCKTVEYHAWLDIKSRCLRKKDKDYLRYGGRGISVCNEWVDSFESFYADMGVRPEGMTLDRIDNDGNYEPSNCRWATRAEQAKNKGIYKNTNSGVAGVRRVPSGKWIAMIGLNGKNIYLGTFNIFDDAVIARLAGEEKHWRQL